MRPESGQKTIEIESFSDSTPFVEPHCYMETRFSTNGGGKSFSNGSISRKLFVQNVEENKCSPTTVCEF